jgi:hypothetical protein
MVVVVVRYVVTVGGTIGVGGCATGVGGCAIVIIGSGVVSNVGGGNAVDGVDAGGGGAINVVDGSGAFDIVGGDGAFGDIGGNGAVGVGGVTLINGIFEIAVCAIAVNVVALDAMTETGDGAFDCDDATINGVGELADCFGLRIGTCGDDERWKNLSKRWKAVLNRVIGDASAFVPGSVCML